MPLKKKPAIGFKMQRGPQSAVTPIPHPGTIRHHADSVKVYLHLHIAIGVLVDHYDG